MIYINKFLPNLNPFNINRHTMRSRFLLFGVFFTLVSTFSYSQSLDGKLKGNVTDKKTGEAIVGAQVTLKQTGSRKGGAATDVDGNYTISPIDPGTYDVEIFFLGYDKKEITGIAITSGRTLTLDVQLSVPETGSNVIGTVNIQQWRDPGFNTDQTITGKSLTGDELDKMPSKDINTALTLTGGVQTDPSGNISIKGDRPGQSKYIVDGIPYGAGEATLPFVDIESLDIITGGVPAEYGDLTGGAIVATTKGPSADFHGRIEALSSQYLDAMGYNLVQGSLTGPLLRSKKDPSKPILGFSISGEYNYDVQNSPPAISVYRVQDNVLNNITNNPIVPAANGLGFNSSADYVTLNQMQKTQVETNTALNRYAFTGKLDFQPADNIDFTVGATVDKTDYRAFIYSFSMFNAANNPEVIQNNYTAFARFRQTFKSNPEDMIQDAYYTVEFSYVNKNSTVQDPNLKNNYFQYGYLGSFKETNTPVYSYKTDTVNGKIVTANFLQGYQQTAVTYTPGGYNVTAENYDKEFFALNNGSVANTNLLQSQGGLLNGQSPGTVYGLWAAPGTYYSQYSKSQAEQYDLTASGTATLAKKHTLKFGIEYQQKVDRSYTVGSYDGIQDLWTQARLLMNTQLTQLDHNNPIIVNSNGNFTDTINYPFQIAAGAQTAFDANFRNHLISIGARDANGNLINQQSYINIDQYAPSDLKLNYFTPDELLENGHSIVTAYGYDYQGNILRGKPSLNNFLDPTLRSEGAYNPIYTAGYIEDKFELNSISFNVGVRVDRFDANQIVLKDPYTMFPIRTAGQVAASGIGGAPVTVPGNIGSNYSVYVDDIANPTKITGFRNGNVWYDANGTEETDPNQIAILSRTGTITPYLVNQNQTVISDASFTNYVPSINLMPRISFSFPISENASFYANYDVLTMTPNTGNAYALDNYYYINTRSVLTTIPNPNLQPQQRTNYEIGFKQKVSTNAAVSVNAYFGQIKNEIELYRYSYAYPIDYTTYNNIDFGTVKGVTLGYDTKRSYDHPYSGLTLSANYTLQFADGTGSSVTTASSLIQAGEPQLRTIYPLNWDTRNQINAILDYRFGHGFDYVGPRNSKGGGWLEDAGANLLLTAKSGNPYTAQANVTNTQEGGLAGRSTLAGTINGSRYPWQFTASLKIDKSFTIASGQGDKKKGYFVNVYLQIDNLLNSLNVVYVYPYTGLPNQDGYLQSTNGISEARNSASQQAFIDQYNVKLNNPGNYVSPRFIRLGAYLQF